MLDAKEKLNLNTEEMIKNGVGYGYHKNRRHSSVKDYIYSTENNIDIIDLEKTKNSINLAIEFIKQIKAKGQKVLFVGEKPEISHLVEEIALSIGEPYVINRFIGGSITNFPQIKKRIDTLHHMLKDKEDGEWNKFTKKEQVLMQRSLNKLDKNFSGLSSLNNLPGVIVLIDSKHEKIPSLEAIKMNIPTISLSNTDCDISKINFPIICNDSSISSVRYILNIIKNSLKV